MPAFQAMSSEREKKSVDVGDDVDRRIGGVAIVHDDDRRAVFGDDARHVGVALQAPHVVDDRGARIERPGRNRGLHRIDRDRNADVADRRQDRLEPRAFFLRRYRTHAAIGPRRFGADIDDVGAFGGHAPGLRDGCRRIEKRPPSENESGVTLSTPMTSGRCFARSRRSSPGSVAGTGAEVAAKSCFAAVS